MEEDEASPAMATSYQQPQASPAMATKPLAMEEDEKVCAAIDAKMYAAMVKRWGDAATTSHGGPTAISHDDLPPLVRHFFYFWGMRREV